MSNDANVVSPANRQATWRELFAKEDWWAVWIGLGLVLVAVVLFANGNRPALLAIICLSPRSRRPPGRPAGL